MRRSREISAQLRLAQITDIGVGDEVAKTLGNDKSDREQMNTFQAQSPSCSGSANGKRDIGRERRHIKFQPAVGIRLPFRRLPAGRGIPGDDPIGPASQPGQLQDGRNRRSIPFRPIVSRRTSQTWVSTCGVRFGHRMPPPAPPLPGEPIANGGNILSAVPATCRSSISIGRDGILAQRCWKKGRGRAK